MASGPAPTRAPLPEDSSGGRASGEPSVTAVGEPVLVRATAIEISRGSILAGRYQVEAVIGRGGSGIVLRAFDRVAQVPVAVKLLKPDLAADPRWIERFSRELRLARQIQHPNVCRVFDIGQADGHWFITMELATGGTLRDQLGDVGNARPLADKLADARAVVAGLAAIHEAGIVHSDVKPDNFLRMADGRLVLSDFGLATNPSDGSMVSIMVGTPSYMAPEVVMGEQSSYQSDVWSIGVVLHEILLGQRPERTSATNGRAVVRSAGRKLSSVERSVVFLVEDCLREDLATRPLDSRAALLRLEAGLASKRALRGSGGRMRASWALPALAAAGAIAAAVGGGRLWHRAAATVAVPTNAAPALEGTPQDWTRTSNVVGSFDEAVHCLSWLEPGRTLRVVLGEPRRAIEIDVGTKVFRPDALPAAAFALGCPQRSKRGELLFEAFDGSGRHQIMLATREDDVSGAKPVTTGTEPTWLSSGTEFLYVADDAHAAVFSIPVMTTSIISESPDDSGLLVGKAVAPDGGLIALRYVDSSLKRHIVLHELPSLSVRHRAVLENAADVEFWGDRGELAFSMDDADGRILAQLDPTSGVVRRLGAVRGRDVGLSAWSHDASAFVASSLQSDVWSVVDGERTTRLTTNGRSFHPDLSSRGDLIVEQFGPGDRRSLILLEKGASPRTVSNGPMDFTPHFLPDGNGWLYVDGARRTIRKCQLSGECVDVHVSADFPFQPVSSPDQRQIAYVTAIGRQRLKVWRDDGSVRDLGPARSSCPPYWTADNRIWVQQGTDQSPFWSQIDASNGEQVRTLPVEANVRHEVYDCPALSAPPGVVSPRQVAAWSSATTEVRLQSAQHLPRGHRP